MAYKELSARFELIKSGRRIQGTRAFLRDDTNGDVSTLPAVGRSEMVDENGSAVRDCLCRTIQTTFEGGHGGSALHTCRYDTDDGGGGGGGGWVTQDKDDESFYLGLESIPMDAPSAYWTFNTGGNAVTELIYKDVVIHTFNLARVDMKGGEYASFLAQLRAYAGTLNATTFRGWGEGTVKFIGASGGSYRNEDGQLRYGAQLSFAGRILKDDHGSPVTDSWLYTWNNGAAAGQGWDKPKNGTKYLYTKTELNDLL